MISGDGVFVKFLKEGGIRAIDVAEILQDSFAMDL